MKMFDLASMHSMLGKRVSLRGMQGTVKEILEEDQALVVETEGVSIQADSMGYARRRAAETVVVPVFDADGSYSKDFLEILNA